MIDRLIKLFSNRTPDLVIGGADPYLRRWRLLRSPFFSFYLHQILRDDDDRALHDHPWASVSIILRGGYYEVRPRWPIVWPTVRALAETWRPVGAVVFRKATAAHRLKLRKTIGGSPIPCWSLFIVGRKARSWGFYCPKGWRHWRDYVAPTADGNKVGRGCE